MGILLAGAIVAWLALRPGSRAELKFQRLTANSAERPVWGAAISPDGKYLAWSDAIGIHLTLISTGANRLMARPKTVAAEDTWTPVSWFPDGSRLVSNSSSSTSGTPRSIMWSVPVLGGPPTQLREGSASGVVSPDGKLIAFLAGGNDLNRELWVMGEGGQDARRILQAAANTQVSSIHWSPDGQRIAYLLNPESFVTITYDYVIESRDLKGGAPVVVLKNSGSWMDFCWLPDGRLVYPVFEPPLNAHDANLWQIKVDLKSGRTLGSPSRITNVAGFSFNQFSLSGDGKKLAFVESSQHATVYVAQRQAGGTRLGGLRRLTMDEYINQPTAWTPDSKAVIFVSNRNRTRGVFKQALDEEAAESVVADPEDVYLARIGLDDSSILYNTENARTAVGRLMRVPVAGGTPQLVMETNEVWTFNCARLPSRVCIIVEPSRDHKEEILTAFDPVRGNRRELLRLPLDTGTIYFAPLSPDGSRIALLKQNESRIQLMSITGRHERDINVKGWNGLNGLDWDWDGKALLLASYSLEGTSLLRVDLAGHVQVLWTQKGVFGTWGIASPDGRYLGMLGAAINQNVWLLENF